VITIKKTARICLSLLLFHVCAPLAAFGWGIATSSDYATQAGIQMFKKGGNAVDAAIAAAFVVNVTTPHKMGIGGGGFILVGKNGSVSCVNHREVAPKSAHPKMFFDADDKIIPYYPQRVTGPNPVGVPGTVAGFAAAHKRWGKLPWKTIMQPAIEVAQNGFPISSNVEADIKKNWSRIEQFAATKSTFSKNGQTPLVRGDLLRQPQMAKTLRTIANNGGSSFYTGPLAKSWLTEAQKLGVRLSEQDLKDYKVSFEKPITFKIFGKTAYMQGPPSGSSIAVGATLRFLEHYYRDKTVPSHDSVERYITSVEALAYFQKLRTETIADRGFATIDPQKYFESNAEKQAWIEIEKSINEKKSKIGTRVTHLLKDQLPKSQRPLPRLPEYGSTAQISTIDNQGLAVSITNTIEEIFGSGVTVPQHGFLLNNELSDFDAEPGRPNSAAVGKRPRSTMSPTLLFDGKTPVAVLGASGGLRTHSSITLFLENYFIHKLDAKMAIASARIHPRWVQGKQFIAEVESFMAPDAVEALREAGYEVDVQSGVYTYPQMLIRREKTAQWEAAADPRYDGMGVVY